MTETAGCLITQNRVEDRAGRIRPPPLLTFLLILDPDTRTGHGNYLWQGLQTSKLMGGSNEKTI